MSKQKITSFEDLYDGIGGICKSTIGFKINSQDASLDFNDFGGLYTLTVPENTFESKDPQKIYDVIYAIKQCEVEDE